MLDGGRRIQSEFVDDDEQSLLRFCTGAPETAVRWGVSQWRETLFNSKQAYQLIREIEETPAELMTPVLRLLLEGARWAHRRSGYLQFLGD
ncbi:hypothetical protein C5L38_14830 [Streptomyces sp. WAC00288]|uniref:Uncharacterized protein n=1 Tax=Streptomyces cinereoruber TaxID=67260 RepID=A0ABX6BJJ4_9ACTN|nr:hypothetical protein C5L38_14830 [Streptomyces sp. WAC00288]KYG54854.1 hypothetical protein AWI43_10605 [Streptomyces sp. WAC04657]PVC74338.1 hypothetical protein DBP18_08940 [Streptomyces sp. CS081A]QEV34057.1 hypothetical protein CP977_19380 [Streptomyces cinereoruber]